jgi:hypothetical protein
VAEHPVRPHYTTTGKCCHPLKHCCNHTIGPHIVDDRAHGIFSSRGPVSFSVAFVLSEWDGHAVGGRSLGRGIGWRSIPYVFLTTATREKQRPAQGASLINP